ncbi:TPA: hypothetical protein DEP94_03240 [Candidatus Nomurabacteria bacterium]|nr:hypothetical protein [Candidatus Nomurabacteria bacterium]
MRTIILHKHFEKRYSRLSQKVKELFKKRRNIFIDDPTSPILSVHTLHGEYGDCLSFNVTGDIRVVYKEIKKDIFVFIDIGTHSELYS